MVNNYYPFGMQYTGTEGSYDLTTDYRYGYNGKEKDDEIKGESNSVDYGTRIYDPRVGRWMSVDPLTKDYPWYTPYQYAGNKPIWCIDLDGEEEKIVILGNNNSKPTILLMSDFKLEQWNNITKTFFATYTKEKTSGYEWKFGYSDYTKVGTPLGFGALTIDATGKTQMLSYDSKDDKLIFSAKSVTLNESLLMSAQAYTKLLIERTNDKQILNFRETLSNVAASASIVAGFGGTLASGSSFGAPALSMSGTIFSSDDMTGSFGGGTFLEKIGTPSTLLNVVKPMVSVLSFGKQLSTGL